MDERAVLRDRGDAASGPGDATASPALPWWSRRDDGPLILAVDSSSRSGSLAIVQGHAVIAEAAWTARGPGGSLHLDLASRLMADHGREFRDLDGIAVATGPGSFTGIRAGLSLAQGLAEALAIPLVGVPTLEALSAQLAPHARADTLTCAVVAAGRGQVHARVAMVGDGIGIACGTAATASVEEVATALAIIAGAARRPVLIGGELLAQDARAIFEVIPWATILPPAAAQRRAAWVADLALAEVDRLRADPWASRFPEDVQPLYLVSPAGPRPADLGWHLPG